MRIFTVLGILFYASVLIFIGALLIVFSFNFIQPQDISSLFLYLKNSLNLRFVVGGIGLVLILISLSFAQLILGRLQKEKTIAFKTASGEVIIALSAVEDMLKRIVGIMPEIKELRPDIIATKKGITVSLRLVLKTETNIPELTTRLQQITRSKIQEFLGIEEQIIIKIHVAKIVSVEDRERKHKDLEREEPQIPFGGYGRV